MALPGNEQIRNNANDSEVMAEILGGEPTTLEQVYHNPEVDLMRKEEEMKEIENGPMFYVNAKDVPGLKGARVGDEVYMKIKCCVKAFDYHEGEMEMDVIESDIADAIVKKSFSYELQIEGTQIEKIEKDDESHL